MSTVPKVPKSPQQTNNLLQEAIEAHQRAKQKRLSILEEIDNLCQAHGLTRTDFFRLSDLARDLQTANYNLETYEIIIEMSKGGKPDV